MKRIIIYTMMIVLAGVGCRKSDNPKLPDFTRVPLPSFVKDAATSVSISATAPNTFDAKFSVDLFFKNDEKPAKFDLVIIKNGDNAGFKVLKADITSFPSTFNITGSQLVTLFGAPIVLGDKFDVGADVYTVEGQKYPAFPIVGIGYGANVPTQYGGLFPSLRYEAVCVFTASEYAGNFNVLQDDFDDDFGVGSIVPVTVVSASKLSIVSPVNGQPIVVDVNTATNITSVASQAYGDYKAAGIDPTWTYGNITVVSNNTSKANFVAPCDGVLSLALEYSVSVGSFTGGPFVLKLKKQ
ncbi:MAG: hypothetical protein ABI813_08835 [Bacteroidota bacterium]